MHKKRHLSAILVLFLGTTLSLLYAFWPKPTSQIGSLSTQKTSPANDPARPDQTVSTPENIQASINGVCFVAPPKPIAQKELAHVDSVSANWVCLMPYAFTPADKPVVLWKHKWQWWGEREDGLIETIRLAKSLGKMVMVKPHLWRRHGAFTGDLNYSTDEEWESWEKGYSAYVLRCAAISDSMGAEMFCFGTELKTPIVQRTDYWLELIRSVKKVYSGKITYAANWDNYQNIPFWKDLDFIGIDAYFPLSSAQTPSVSELQKNWSPIKANIHSLSQKVGKPVLFTEFGYRSIDQTAEKPYETSRGKPWNEQAQANATEALLSSFWSEDWFKGGFVWKWYAEHLEQKINSTDYSPQNKSAQRVLDKYFGNGG